MAERVGGGTPCLLGSLGVREVAGSRTGRNIKESFSSYQETGQVFSPEMPSIPNSEIHSPRGEVTDHLRGIQPSSHDASSHFKTYRSFMIVRPSQLPPMG